MTQFQPVPLPLTRRVADAASSGLASGVARTPLVLTAAAVACGLFWACGGMIGFPHSGPYDALVFRHPLAAAVVLLAAVTLVIATLAGTTLAGRVRYDAGWGAAVFALLALRMRGDSVYYTLDGRGRGVFLVMAVELLVWFVLAAGLWVALHLVRERGARSPGLKRWLELPRADERRVDRPGLTAAAGRGVTHLLISAAGCAVVVMMVARNDAPVQTTLAVLAGGWFGAWAAYAVVPVRPAVWAWSGPALAGVIGYAAATLATPEARLELGQPGGPLAPMALPLPLEWIGAGLPGALVAYVRSRTRFPEAAATRNVP